MIYIGQFKLEKSEIVMTKVDKEPKDTKEIIFRLLCFLEGLLSSWITAPHKSMDARMIRLICNSAPLLVLRNFTIYKAEMSMK